jgi:hypothetical protein
VPNKLREIEHREVCLHLGRVDSLLGGCFAKTLDGLKKLLVGDRGCGVDAVNDDMRPVALKK